MHPAPPLLLIGVPRSGSTWLAEILARATGRLLAMEPDDAYRWPEALHAKRGLGDYPNASTARASAEFRELWRLALKEPRRFSIERNDPQKSALGSQSLSVTRGIVGDHRVDTPGSTEIGSEQRLCLPDDELVVKTVNASLCADVIAGWLGAEVIMLSRDLRKVISSWTLMAGFEPEDLHLDPWVRQNVLSGMSIPQCRTRLEKIALTVAVLDKSLKLTTRRNGCRAITYEELVENPHQKVVDLLTSLALNCDDSVHESIDTRQAPGSGFETKRSSAQLREWETRLTDDQWAEVDAVLKLFRT
nr:sulfotransferase [Candidatus Rhodoblastus alkanivorans]